MSGMKLLIEQGPKQKRFVGFAPDWPGFERNGKTEHDLLEKLEAYLPRYTRVAARAGQEAPFLSQNHIEVIGRYPGNTSTDYWGVSHVPAACDKELPSAVEWERRLSLLAAAWAEFDMIAARVSSELQRGSRGGGRMRDEVIGHTWMTEVVQITPKLGLDSKFPALLTPKGLASHRALLIDAFRRYHQAGKLMVGRSWTLPFLLRRAAYHVLDHAWEMEDKDLSGNANGLEETNGEQA